MNLTWAGFLAAVLLIFLALALYCFHRASLLFNEVKDMLATGRFIRFECLGVLFISLAIIGFLVALVLSLSFSA